MSLMMMSTLREMAPQLKGRKYDYQVLPLLGPGGSDPVVTLAANAEVSGQLRVDSNGDALIVAIAAEAYDGNNAVLSRTSIGLVTIEAKDHSGSGKELVATPIPVTLFAPLGPGEEHRQLRVPIFVVAGGNFAFKLKNSTAAERRIRMVFEVLRFTGAGALTF